MPITKYIKGNLLDHDGPIAHGVNTQGKMNSGVAKAIREKYPDIYDEYVSYIKYQIEEKGRDPLGACSQYRDAKGHTLVYNMFTQDKYGYDGKRYVSYKAVKESFDLLNYLAQTPRFGRALNPVGIPKIGAGLGGGDWEVIEQIIDEVTPHIEIWVYEL